MTFRAPYATAHTILLTLYEPGSVAIAASKTFAAGDVQVSTDDGATWSNLATLPTGTNAAGRVALAFSVAELTCKRLAVRVIDQTVPKEFDDDHFVVETENHASAQHPNASTVSPAQAVLIHSAADAGNAAATAVLLTPANKIKTNAANQVETSNPGGTAPITIDEDDIVITD